MQLSFLKNNFNFYFPIIIFCIIIAFVFMHRFDSLLRLEVIGDEIHTYERTKNSISYIIDDEIAPFNSILNKFILQFYTDSSYFHPISFTRGFFLGLSFLILLIVFSFSYRISNIPTAIMATILVAFSPEFIRQSVINRYYMVYTIIPLVLPLFYISILNSKKILYKTIISIICFLLITIGLFNQALYVPVLAISIIASILGLLADHIHKHRLSQIKVLFTKQFLFFTPLLFSLITYFYFKPNLLISILNLLNLDSLIPLNRDSAGTSARHEWLEYQLSLSVYINYLTEHLLPFSNTIYSLILLFILTSIGSIYLYKKSIFLASSYLGLLLFPIPFFFISVGHYWTERYFLFQTPIFAILIATGLYHIFSIFNKIKNTSAQYTFKLSMSFITTLMIIYLLSQNENINTKISNDANTLKFSQEAVNNYFKPGDTVITTPNWSGFRAGFFLDYYLNHSGIFYPNLNSFNIKEVHYTDVTNTIIEYSEKYNPCNTWIIKPSGAAHSERISGVFQELNNIFSIFNINHIDTLQEIELWSHNVNSFELHRILHLKDFSEHARSLAAGAKLITENEDHILYLEVPEDSPVEIEDGRPMPTLWINNINLYKNVNIDHFSENDFIYFVNFDVKHEAISQGQSPNRTLNVIARETIDDSRTWENKYFPFSGTSDWFNAGMVLHPNKEVKHPPSEELTIGIGNRGGSGKIWIKNIRVYIIVSNQ